MKYRSDFVTNSSSTSFAASAASILAALLAAFGLLSGKTEPEEEEQPDTFRLELSSRKLELTPGKSASVDATVYRTSAKGETTVAENAVIFLSATPPDVTVSPDTEQGQVTASIEVSEEAQPGSYAVSFAAKIGGSSLQRSVTVLVTPDVELELTFPVGPSPNVFVRGWVFGAKCILAPGTEREQDLSDSVQWSGTGTFSPETGARCWPAFSGPGANTITLTCQVGETTVTKSFGVSAVSTQNFARVGDKAKVPADAHGCPACPHAAIGPIIAGSSLVLIDGQPAARVGDPGIHAACCGPNAFTIVSGDARVLIEGRPAAKIGDMTQHCGGMGQIVEGSAGE